MRTDVVLNSCVLALSGLLMACSSTPNTTLDGGGDGAVSRDVLSADAQAMDAPSGRGQLGDPCQSNRDCASNICISANGAMICAMGCRSDQDCANGGRCVPMGEGELRFMACVPAVRMDATVDADSTAQDVTDVVDAPDAADARDAADVRDVTDAPDAVDVVRPNPCQVVPEPDVDCDRDGVLDAMDNCRGVANADQADLNANRIGDACETAARNCMQLNTAGTDFSGQDLRGCVWRSDRGMMTPMNLQRADLTCAQINGNFFSPVDFSGANMTGVLVNSNWLGNYVFRGTNLRRSYISGSNVLGTADYTDADMSDSIVRGSNWNTMDKVLLRTNMSRMIICGSNTQLVIVEATVTDLECSGLQRCARDTVGAAPRCASLAGLPRCP
jgi:uncharacterized protein YjbI with pentapeptide repeats